MISLSFWAEMNYPGRLQSRSRKDAEKYVLINSKPERELYLSSFNPYDMERHGLLRLLFVRIPLK
jgi:hypothetical protein